jgi:hypothetical protein
MMGGRQADAGPMEASFAALKIAFVEDQTIPGSEHKELYRIVK